MSVGCCNGAALVNAYEGSTSNGVSYRPNGTVIKAGANALTGQPTYAKGDVVGMVIDFTARTVKFNNNGGTFTPTVDITSLGTDIFYSCTLGDGGTFSSVDVSTASPPAGATAWDDAPMFANANLNIVSHGDSISLTSAVQRNYLPRLASILPARVQWTRCGINGGSWNYNWVSSGYDKDMLDDAPIRVDPARSASMKNVLILFAGTNGMFTTLGNHSAATEYTNFQTYYAARLAAGWQRSEIIVCTMLPRTSFSEATRTTYNTSLVNGAAGGAYKICRLDLIPEIGLAGQNTNLTWFLDGTHPTDAGHEIIARAIYALISTLPPATVQTFQQVGIREDLR